MASAASLIPRFEVLIEDDLPAPDNPLLAAYGAALSIRRDTPTVTANFVSSVDGVVAFSDEPKAGTSAVSLNSWPDRFVMGLLRASADCVLVGAGTLRRDSRHQWTAGGIARELKDEMVGLRRDVTGQEMPAPLVVVTASGTLPDDHPALVQPATDVLILTTEAGRLRLPELPDRVRSLAIGEGDSIEAGAIVEAIQRELGATTILCEGGPTLLGELATAGLLDELFLTIAPHLTGRSEQAQRPGLIEAAAFARGETYLLKIRSLRRHADHLFLRYGRAVQ